ncbi:hypothetical protein V6N13_092896 [Hibiscus sabdariffa]|uniref:Uncharacterized protein n=3 Tax=Hibiscus sabdariffa TaxID=183260 RepID=A0ABR2B6J7_9ROSI
MVFEERKRDQISNEPENPILSDNLEETNAADAGGGEDEERANEHELHSTSASRSKQGKQDRQGVRPLLDEVALLNSTAGKNPAGAKLWRCNHYKINFTSTYTRIHTHFFGPEAGKKADIQRCKALMNDRDAEAVDLKIMRCLCANAIAFNCLRSPQWHEMVQAINQAPKGYKSPSFEKARTSLLDECYRSVEKELSLVKDTWYVHGVSVVSDGWSNCKQDQLINVIATNSRGAMFMYSGVFNGVEKAGQVIGDFLLEAIEKIGPSNVLQVVTDNAKNCIAAGREVQKVHKHIFWSPCVCHTLNLIFKDFADAFSWMKSTYKSGENTYEEKQLRDQFAEFQLRKGIYSMPQAQMDAVTMDAIDWWSIYGSQTSELAEVAKKVLSQPISSSLAERAWSTYGHVHSLKRNRLNSSRADKLVYIYTNLRLLSRYTDDYKNGPFRKWDIDLENSCLEESPLELEDMGWADLENDLNEEETLAD